MANDEGIEEIPVTLDAPAPEKKRRTRRKQPAQKPAESFQAYRTPVEFLRAAEQKLGIQAFSIDVSADDDNAIVDLYYTVKEDGLASPWNPIHPQWETPIGGIAWCNPEFGAIEIWVQKALAEANCREPAATSAVLVPAGVGSNWWKDYVHGKARVLLLNGRLCFIHDWETQLWQVGEKVIDGLDQVGQRKYPTKPLYPKDCCLLIYGPGIIPAYEVWDWRAECHA